MKQVLIVEDEERFLSILVQEVIRAGYQVRYTNSEDEAFLLAEVETFDVIVTDKDLQSYGQGSGDSLIRRLQVAGVKAKMVLMSADIVEARQLAEELGVRYIEKRVFGFLKELLAFLAE